MSLWYQAPQSTFEPRDSRSIGWSQVPNRKAVLLDDDVQSPQHSTGGGTLLDLSNTMQFGTPRTNIQFDPTVNFAQFGFENIQDVNLAQFQMMVSQSLSELSNKINFYAEQGIDYLARIVALETWKATGITGCEPEIFMRDWSFDPVSGDIVNEYKELRFVDGLMVFRDGGVDDPDCPGTVANGTTATTDCPNNFTGGGGGPILEG